MVDSPYNAAQLFLEHDWSPELDIALYSAVIRRHQNEEVLAHGRKVVWQRRIKKWRHILSWSRAPSVILVNAHVLCNVKDGLVVPWVSPDLDEVIFIIVCYIYEIRIVLLDLKHPPYGCIAVKVGRPWVLDVHGADVVIHNGVLDGTGHDGIENGLATRFASLLGNMHFRKYVKRQVQVSVAGHSTGTANLVDHLRITPSQLAICSLRGHLWVPYTVGKFFGPDRVHVWDDVAHDASSIQSMRELVACAAQLLRKTRVVADPRMMQRRERRKPMACGSLSPRIAAAKSPFLYSLIFSLSRREAVSLAALLSSVMVGATGGHGNKSLDNNKGT